MGVDIERKAKRPVTAKVYQGALQKNIKQSRMDEKKKQREKELELENQHMIGEEQKAKRKIRKEKNMEKKLETARDI